jgi:hypothetical protein
VHRRHTTFRQPRSRIHQEGNGQTIATVGVKAWQRAVGVGEGPPFRPVAKDGRVGARGPQMTGLPTGRLDRRTADCGSFARAFMSTPIRCTRCFGAVSIRMAALKWRGEGMEWPQPPMGSGLGPRALRGASPLCRVGADREMSTHDHTLTHRRVTISPSPPSYRLRKRRYVFLLMG